MSAVVRASYASTATPTYASAEGGAKYNREESLAGATTPIPKPNSAGSNYSYAKPFRLEVTTSDTTTLSNLRHRIASAPAAGLKLWFIDDGATFVRGNVALTDNGTTDDAAPAGATVAPTSDTVYDATGASASSTGPKGDFIRYILGVSNLYLGGAGSAIALPNLILTYDEA